MPSAGSACDRSECAAVVGVPYEGRSTCPGATDPA